MTITPVKTQPLLDVRNVSKSFVQRRNHFGRPIERVHAVDDVSFTIRAGETLGLVGESGSGKSTLGRVIVGLTPADSGTVYVAGEDLLTMSRREMRQRRREIQMIFQDPLASLDPTKRIRDSVAEPLVIFDDLSKRELSSRVSELLERVNLGPHHLDRYPAELSGGQRQRVSIARALALGPQLIVADEAVSALDVSTQAEVINLLQRLQAEQDLTYLFISHNLAVIRHVSTRIAVMYLGRIVEEGPAAQVYDEPLHPYTQVLLAAVPDMGQVPEARKRIIIGGDVPDPANPPPGCNFSGRCPHAMAMCFEVDPTLMQRREDSSVACHLHDHGPALGAASVDSLAVPVRASKLGR
ncbi:ABC transporter ATP-binding protein [Rhodococcoides fascians]|uniref:ABC transporter ATP-binding protein n=1 Tax=Rhodococcoides fascians TaxID=1828 RepID=UPI000A3FC2BA|nr:ABC transporter ATP-binding protein [Rhodococcus fascians]